jgi:hypothetical protein
MITVSSDSDNYTTGSGGISGTIAGYAVGSLSKTSDTTYTATFTITDDGTDVSAGDDIPVSITLADFSGNTSSAYTTAISQNNDAIYANSPDITLSADTNSIAEDGGVATLTAAVTGSLNNQWPTDITVNLSYSGTATATTDYTKSDSITISAGNTTGTTTVTGVADTLYDAASSETVIVDIDTVSVGSESGGTQQQTISITDAELSPTVTLSTGSSSVAENGGTSAITATLSHPTYEDVTVNLGYSGTATAGTDYTTPSSSIVISAGSTSANATTGITATDDSTEEGSESIIIDVSNVSGGGAAESGTQQQTVSITDDDDTTPPTVSHVTSTTENGTYKVGDTVAITVEFDEAVMVTGSPQLTLETGTTDRVVDYASGSGATTLTFNYTVQAGDSSSDLGYTSTAALALNGGTIQDSAGNDATLTLASPGVSNSLSANKAIIIDGVFPTVSISDDTTGTATGDVTYTFTFSEAVTGFTADDITVSGGSKGTFTAVSGTVYTLVVTPSAGSTSDITVDVAADIATDAAGNTNTAATQSTQAVDTVVPTVSSVSVPSNGTYKASDSLDFTVNYNENITVNTSGGTPRLALSIGSVNRYASYVSGSGNSALVFSYTVQSGDSDTNGIVLSATLDTNGGTLQDSAGNSANTTLNSVGSLTSVLVDTTVPTVSNVSSTTADGSYKEGDVVAITVTFSEAVTVTGTPQLTLETGDSNRTVNYTSGSGTDTLIFNYTVQAGDTSADLDYASITALTLNGGSIQDSAGNDATLTLVAPGSTGSLAANKSLVIDTAVPVFDTVSVTDTDIFYKAGETITFGVNLGETGLTVTANLSVFDSDFDPDVALADDGDGSYSLTTSALNTSGNMQEGTIAVTFTASDSAGNQASNSSLSLNLDKTAPTFDSNNSTPNDNATGVTVGDNIVIDFSEAVTLLSGQIITLADVTNGVIVETFTATSTNSASGNNGGTISVSSDKVTLNPGTDLLAGTEYAVQVSASAIQDLAGNSFAGISDNTTFSFRTAPTLALSASATEMSEKGGSVTYTVSLQDGKGNPFTASENIVAAIQFGGTASKDTDYSVTGLSSSDDITIASGSSSATLSVTATDDAEEDDAETIVVALNSVSSGTATIGSGSSASVTINENNPPVFSNLDAAPAYIEDGSAVIIDGDATVSDTELDALNGGNGNYDGATLTIARSGGASGNDLFANNGLLGALNEGEDLVYNGTTIGTVTSNSNGTLILTFNSSATTALVNSMLQNITYANSANEPAGSVVLSFTFNDGTENSSGTNQVTANITASNDAPTLTASVANPTFTEGGSAATVFSSANVSTVESGQTLSGLMLMVTNVSDSGSEVLTVDGTAITLASDVNGTTTANGLSYTVAVAGTTATATFISGSLTEADLQTLIDGISYQNNSQDPTTDSNRVVTLTSLTDSGSENETTSLSIASTVTLTAVNDEPTLTATAVNPTFTENGDAAVVFSSATASTVETGQTLSGLVLTVNNVTDSGSEVLTVDGTAITLDDAASGTTATNSLSYAVTVASDTVTVYFTSGSLSNEALQTLVDGINYQNSSDDPTIDNARVVTISSLTDSGSGSGDNDNTNDTLSIASKVTLSAVNDVPMVTGLVSGFSATEDVAANLDVSGITVSDAEGDTISIVLTVNSGVLTAANGDGSINGVTVGGSGTASVILSGSVADINIWLDTANMLSFTSSSNTNGNVTLTVTPSDAEAGSAVSSSVNVTAVNDAPVISGTPATSVSEDSAYSFIPSGSDVDTGDSLTYSIANKPDWADFSTSTGALTGTPDNDDVGSYNDIRITVADSSNATDILTPFSISVTNVNDAPTISGTPAIKAVQDSAYSFTPVGNDVDTGDSLTYSINKTPDWASFDPATGTLSGTPTNDDVGNTTYNIVISVSDGEETVALTAFDLEVENINDAPVISGTPATTVAEDTAYSFTPDSNDIDADTLTFSIENKPSWASFDTATGELSGKPTNDHVGSTQDILISVSDGAGTVSLPAFTLTVTNVNDAPTISGSPATKAVQDTAYSFTPAGNDVDVGDTLAYSISNKPGWASFDAATGTLSGTPTNDDVGTTTSNIVISVSDGEETASLSSFDLTVTNVNDAPTISGTPATSVEQDTDYSFIPTSEDIDGDTLSFMISNKPAWASFDTATGALTGTPDNNEVGITSDIRISVTDGAETATLAAFSLEVINVNDAPTISGTPSTKAVEDAVYSFTPVAGDIDDDPLTFSIINKPDWMSFNTATGALSGTPTNDDVGETDDIIISVSDDAEIASLAAFRVTVVNTNDAPVISGTPVTKAVQGSGYSFTPVGNDVDTGDSLTYSINNKPGWANFDTTTGALTGTPHNDDVGSYNDIQISVSDGTVSVALAPFSIEVANVNDAPVISGTPATTVAEDSDYRFIPTGSDVDAGDNLTYSISNKPSWASFDTTTGALTGTPDNDNVGITRDIVISVSDGKATTALTAFSVEVTNTNDAPVAVNDNSYAFVVSDSGSYTLDVLANDTDVDNDTLQLAWISTDSGSVSIQGASVVLETDLVGVVNLKYGISDGNGGTATGIATVMITSNSAQAPTITAPENVEVKANALFTKVDLGVAVAENSSGEPLPVSLVDHSTFFAPGQHTVYWRTQDAKGNEARASHQVTVYPLVSISKDDVTTEGTNHTVKVFLNGEAPSYPVVIPYTVSGSSDSADHNLVSDNVIINSGTEGSIEFSVNADEVAEGTETVEITLDDSLNLGSKSHYVLSVYEENVAPEVSIMVSQSGESRPLVENSAVAVTVTATVTDANAGDTHSYNWLNDNAQLANISQSYNQFIFSPEGLTPGIYQLKLEVTDSASAMVTTDIYIEVVAQLATLDGQDSDGDLIPDNQEGFTDSDNDGIPDYQDAISECNVIQEQALESQSYLVEGEPGVCLRKGVTLASNQTGGAQLMTHELTDDTEAENIGGLFDFVAYGLPTAGQTYQVVFPQRLPIPANAVYRKYKESSVWVDFQTDASNYVSSTKGEEGYCPPPGDSVWSQGLTEGDWCVQLTIQDGGPNDDDGMANGSIVDPGGVATTSKNTLPVAVNDSVYVAINGSLQINVLGNDSDADNDSLIITSVSANFGTVSIENGMIAYRAADKFYGTDIISYSVTDGNGGTAYADVTVNVTQSGGVVKNSAGGGSMGDLAVFTLGLLGAFRRHGRKFAAALLALLSFSSQANWYLDADLGVSKADARLTVADSQLQETDKRGTAWSLGLGYHINPDWAVTGRYLDLGEGSATLSPGSGMNPTEYHASVAKVTPALAEGFAVDVSYTVLEENSVSLQAVLGGFWWEVDFDSEYQGTHITSSEDGLDPYIGIAVDYQLSDQWSAGWQFTRYFIDLNDVTTLTINLMYTFGNESN